MSQTERELKRLKVKLQKRWRSLKHGELLDMIAQLRTEDGLTTAKDCLDALRPLGQAKRGRHMWIEAMLVLDEMRTRKLDMNLAHLIPASTCCRRGKQWQLVRFARSTVRDALGR